MSEEQKTKIREILARMVAKNKAASEANPAPRYDEVYFRGVEWLNKQ